MKLNNGDASDLPTTQVEAASIHMDGRVGDVRKGFGFGRDLEVKDDLLFQHLRGLAIISIVFAHVGFAWFWEPYTNYITVVNSIFFFISGVSATRCVEKYGSGIYFVIRRVVELYVPWVLICLISLLLFVLIEGRLPEPTMAAFRSWLLMLPPQELTPFPLGQSWWLHVLVVLTFAIPLLTTLYRLSSLVVAAHLGGVSVISAWVLMYGHPSWLSFLGIDLYYPLFYSLLYGLGLFRAMGKCWIRDDFIALTSWGAFLLLTWWLVTSGRSISYAKHCFPPNLYFEVGSLATIYSILLLGAKIVRWIDLLPYSGVVSIFVFRHTFSIYLVHTLAIYLSETIFSFLLPAEKGVLYAFVKLSVVLALTGILAVPFTWAVRRVRRVTERAFSVIGFLQRRSEGAWT